MTPLSKLLAVLCHYPAPMGAAVIGWTCGRSGLDPQTQGVLYAAGSALLLAGGLKLAGLLPDQTTVAFPQSNPDVTV